MPSTSTLPRAHSEQHYSSARHMAGAAPFLVAAPSSCSMGMQYSGHGDAMGSRAGDGSTEICELLPQIPVFLHEYVLHKTHKCLDDALR